MGEKIDFAQIEKTLNGRFWAKFKIIFRKTEIFNFFFKCSKKKMIKD